MKAGSQTPVPRHRSIRIVASAVSSALVGVLWLVPPAAGTAAQPSATVGPAMADAGRGTSLLARVRAHLEEERKRLVEFAYRERRRPVKVSPFGKVAAGDEQIFDVYPSADPDRPRRVLIAVNGRPVPPPKPAARSARTPEQLARERRDRERRNAEARKRAQERLDDAFRVFEFTFSGTAIVDGTEAHLVALVPRVDAETHSDMGKWMKKFRGTAWVDVASGQLMQLEMTAFDTIGLGWGFIGRIGEGTTITYTRHPIEGGQWFPERARFRASGRTLLFRSFDLDVTTEWYDYRPYRDERSSVSRLER